MDIGNLWFEVDHCYRKHQNKKNINSDCNFDHGEEKLSYFMTYIFHIKSDKKGWEILSREFLFSIFLLKDRAIFYWRSVILLNK